jgi:hypothetical protein
MVCYLIKRRENFTLPFCWEKWKMRTKFWSENLKVRDHSEFLGIDGMVILERILGKYGGNVWNGCIWLRIGTSDGLL